MKRNLQRLPRTSSCSVDLFFSVTSLKRLLLIFCGWVSCQCFAFKAVSETISFSWSPCSVTNVLNASDDFNIIQDAYFFFFPPCHIEQSPWGEHYCQDEGAQRQGVRSGESSSSEESQIGWELSLPPVQLESRCCGIMDRYVLYWSAAFDHKQTLNSFISKGLQ